MHASAVPPPLPDRARWRRWVPLALSMLAYLACMFLVPFSTRAGENIEPWGNGFVVLLVGWLGVLTGTLEWLANPLLMLAWILIVSRRYKSGRVCAFLALLLALLFLARDDVLVDEAGHMADIASWDLGYWLWVASTALALISGLAPLGFRRIANPAAGNGSVGLVDH